MIFTLKTYEKGYNRYSRRAWKALFKYKGAPSIAMREESIKNHRICRLITRRLRREYNIAKANREQRDRSRIRFEANRR